MAISAQTVNYNLPGLNGTNLKLDGPVLAGIYTGKIRNWNDPAIAALNPGTTLPNNPIIPVRRAEASGDTFIFTQYLTFSAPAWQQALGGGVNVAWGSRCRCAGRHGARQRRYLRREGCVLGGQQRRLWHQASTGRPLRAPRRRPAMTAWSR